MNLNTANWKEFQFSRLICDIYKSKALNKDDLISTTDIKNGIRYITRTSANNGCEMIADISSVDVNYIQKGNAITIGDTTATCFYQPDCFITGDHMVVVRAEWLNQSLGMWIITILNREQYKYSYGRAFLMDRIKNTLIKLPIKQNIDKTPYFDNSKKYSEEGYVPDWQWMEKYIKCLHHKPLTTQGKSNQMPNLMVTKWEEFTLNKIFTLKGGFYNKKPEHSIEGTIPFLASTESNNGVTEFYAIEDIIQWNKVGNEDYTLDNKIYQGNCIAVTVNGSVCNAFYQALDFTCSHDITALYLKGYKLNAYLAHFLCTIIMQDKYRWSYGRKPHNVKKFGKSVIKLPIQYASDGNPIIDDTKKYSKDGYIPDWTFMENYIKTLPYGDRL